jgi:hypothetical protein
MGGVADEYPLITFADGPAGPCPRIVGTGAKAEIDEWIEQNARERDAAYAAWLAERAADD